MKSSAGRCMGHFLLKLNFRAVLKSVDPAHFKAHTWTMKKLHPWHSQQLWHPRPLGVGLRGRPGTKLLPSMGCVSSHGLNVETAPQLQGSQSDRREPLLDGSGTEVARTPRHRSLSLPTVSPPPDLQDALKRLFSRHPVKARTLDGQVLAKHLLSRRAPCRAEESQRRKGELRVVSGSPCSDKPKHDSTETVQSVIRYGKREAIAYAASRLQACYGATLRVFSEIGRHVPSFRPETLMDFGSGLGTAVWAADQLWGSSLYEYHCVDSSQEMGDLARSLRAGGEEVDPELNPFVKLKETIPGVHFRQYLSVSNKVQYDIIVAAYTLGDLPSENLRRLSIASLWKKTKHFLVLIEPGNWAGFHNVIKARELVLNTSWNSSDDREDASSENSHNGYVFAPCPHDMSCPLSTDSSVPCHFAQRVQLALSERNTSLKHRGFRIENFSYVVLRKGERPEHEEVGQARLIQPIKRRSRHLVCKLCCPNGEAAQVVLTKSKHPELYKQGRQSEWGDLLPYDDSGIRLTGSKEPTQTELSSNT